MLYYTCKIRICQQATEDFSGIAPIFFYTEQRRSVTGHIGTPHRFASVRHRVGADIGGGASCMGKTACARRNPPLPERARRERRGLGFAEKIIVVTCIFATKFKCYNVILFRKVRKNSNSAIIISIIDIFST